MSVLVFFSVSLLNEFVMSILVYKEKSSLFLIKKYSGSYTLTEWILSILESQFPLILKSELSL